MKRRIVAVALVIVLVFAFASCSAGSGDRYNYVSVHAYDTTSEFRTLSETLDYVYEDTVLVLEDDGTWRIEYNVFLFFNTNIDEGTYTVDANGTYIFTGFEYGLDSKGYKTNDGFNIVFYLSDIRIVSLSFSK